MNTIGDRFKDFLLERRTSPMYKTFIISWIIWNWNFLYVLLFENSEYIFKEKGLLKSEYIRNFYLIDWNVVFSKKVFIYTFGGESGIWHAFIGPIFSIILYFFLLSDLELIFRRKATDIKEKQLAIDKKSKEEEVKIEKLKGDEESEKLRMSQLENQRLKIQIDNLTKLEEKNKLQFGQLNKNFDKTELREKDYLALENNPLFDGMMQGLQKLINASMRNYSNSEIFDTYKGIYIPYELLETNIDEDMYEINEKGKYFLKKYTNHNPKIMTAIDERNYL